MESLPKDVKQKMALDLSPPDLIIFCASGKEINKDICGSDDFWRLKIEKDYSKMFKYYQKHNMTFKKPKNTYIRKFTEI